MKSVVRKYPVITLPFTLSVLISWAGWIPYAASKSRII